MATLGEVESTWTPQLLELMGRNPPPEASFLARVAGLKRAANGCEPVDFDAVMQRVYKAPEGWTFIDHTIVEHEGKLHVFYISGRPENFGTAVPYQPGTSSEIGNGHAVGTGLFDLEYVGTVLDRPQGDWDCLTTGGAPSIARFRDHFVMVYVGRGTLGQCMGLARSEDLLNWAPAPDNPIFPPPEWARNCKDPHVFLWKGTYYIYFCSTQKEGSLTVALTVTDDWEHFEHLGPVCYDVASLRGTGGVESPCVFERDGVFHLFYINGPGMWHAVSDSPTRWLGTAGRYLVGPFVAAEVFRWQDRWWLSSTRKEVARIEDRRRGISNHGTPEDELRNLQGMFLGEVMWEGDFPTVQRFDHGA